MFKLQMKGVRWASLLAVALWCGTAVSTPVSAQASYPSRAPIMENPDARAVSDAVMVTIRRIETMPGPWPSLADQTAAAIRAVLSEHSDALKTYASFPDGHIEMGTVDVRGTSYKLVRAARGFERRDDPYVVIIGPRPGQDRPTVAVVLGRPHEVDRA